MNKHRLTLIALAATLLGCSTEQPKPISPPSVRQAVAEDNEDLESGIPLLGDEIAALSLSDATALSDYLANGYGIAPPGTVASGKRDAERVVSPRIRELGDRIAGLSVGDASALSHYLEERHGLKPARDAIQVAEGQVRGISLNPPTEDSSPESVTKPYRIVPTVPEQEELVSKIQERGGSVSVEDGVAVSVSLTSIRGIEIQDLDITLERLTGLPDLREIAVFDSERSQVSDRGLQHLKRLRKLRRVEIIGHQVTDKGLEYLASVEQIRELTLSSNQITDDGLAHLKGLSGLRKLCISSGRVTDAGLGHLKGLPNLQNLSLAACTNVGNAGLVQLQGLSELVILDLSYTGITDTGLRSLRSLDQLRGLVVAETAVSETGIKQLKEALPECKVIREPPH